MYRHTSELYKTYLLYLHGPENAGSMLAEFFLEKLSLFFVQASCQLFGTLSTYVYQHSWQEGT